MFTTLALEKPTINFQHSITLRIKNVGKMMEKNSTNTIARNVEKILPSMICNLMKYAKQGTKPFNWYSVKLLMFTVMFLLHKKCAPIELDKILF